MSARRRGDVDAVLRLLGDGVRGPRRDPARDGHGTPRALAARHPRRRARGAAASSRRGGDARRHRPGGEPLAHRGAGDADPARRDARRHPGHRRVQQPAPHRGRDAPSRPCATRRRRRRRSAPARRHRRRGRAARRRRCRHRRRADRDLPARRRTRRPEPVDGRRRERRLDRDARSIPTWSRGSLDDVHGDAVAVSRVFADGGDLRVGDTVPVRMADTTPATLRVAAIYDRAAGLGDVLLDPAVARRHAAAPGRHGAVRRRRRGRRAIALALRLRPSRRAVAEPRRSTSTRSTRPTSTGHGASG